MTDFETGTGLYEIPQEMVDFRETIRQIATEKIAPRAADIDRDAEYPHDIRKILGEQDILGLPFDEEYGGTGTGTLMLQIGVEEIAKACASRALILMIQELGTLPIQLFGSDELKSASCRDARPASGPRPSPSRSPRPAPTPPRCGPPRSKTATNG